MATVIEEALIRIRPDFEQFKPDLVAGLKAATKGVTAKVRIEVDETGLKGRIKAAAAEAGAGVTTKVKVEADTARAKAQLGELRNKTVTVKAQVETSGSDFWNSSVRQKMLAQAAADVVKSQREQVSAVKAAQAEIAQAETQAHAERIRRERATQAEITRAETQAHAERIRREQAAQADATRRGGLLSAGPSTQNTIRQRLAEEAAAERVAHAENDRRNAQAVASQKKADAETVASAAKAAAEREKIGKAEAQAYRENEKRNAKARQDAEDARNHGFRLFAEFLNVLPGIGGVGPNAAKAIALGITAGAPLIGAAITSAMALGFGTGGIATGIVIAAKDPRIVQAGTALSTSLGNTLEGAARPFTDTLLAVMPHIGEDLAALKPDIAGLFAPLAETLPHIEAGLVGALQAALPGMATASQNAAQYIDAIAAKGPEIGKAFGTFIADVTDPKSIDFLKGLIDLVDALLVGIGKLVKALAEISSVLKPVWSALGGIAKEVTDVISSMSAAGSATGLLTATAAVALIGFRWKEARQQYLSYKAAVDGGGFSASALGGSLFGRGAPAVEGATGAAGRGIGRGILRTAGGAALGLGIGIGGTMLGAATTQAGHPILGGAISGAATGASLGLLVGPEGAAVGAGIGAVAGAAAAHWQQHNDQLERAKSDLQDVADQYSKTGDVMSAVGQIMASNDTLLKNLATHGKQFGADLPTTLKAVGAGDPATIQKALDEAKADKAKADKGASFWNATDKLARGDISLWDLITGKGQVDPKQAKRSAEDQKLIDAYKAALDAATTQQAKNDANAGPTNPVQDISTMFEKFQAGTQPTQQMQVINSILDTYNNWKMAVRGVQDAQYQQGQTAQSTAHANEEALHGVATAEHSLAQAHFASGQAQKSLTEAQRSLTQARKDAIQNLKELSRQVRDLGDNEEELKIRYVQAQLAEVQTRGLPAESLVRRQAVVGLDEAKNALADFQSDAPALRSKYALAQRQGVEGAPGVVSTKNAVAQSRNALQEAQYSEKEAVRNVDQARQNYNNTLESSRRANIMAARAVEDANKQLGQQWLNLQAVEQYTHQTTTQIDGLATSVQKLVQNPYTMTLDDRGSIGSVEGKLKGLYDNIAQLGQQFGINLPGWIGGVDSTSVPGSPGYVGPDKHPTSGPDKRYGGYAGGGPVTGWSPHDRADNIPAWLTAEEFVVNAKSSRKHRGLLETINSDRGYADGGFVLPFDTTVDRWIAPIQKNISELRGAAAGAAAPGGASAGGQSIGQVQNWLKQVVDPLPYVMGANGPSAYDCSSLVGEVWARLTGNPDYKRYFVTGSERAFLARHGFRDGRGTFTVGFNAGHTMGNLAGLNFEAANSRSGIHVGSGTSNVTSFPNVMYLPQLGDKFLSVGAPSSVPDVSRVTAGGMWGAIMRKILTDAAAGSGGAAGGDPGKSGGGSVERWRSTVTQALRDNGLSTSDPFVNAVLRQIGSESSGNEKIIQQVHDVNWPNNKARGLMQTTPTTFAQYAFPGHGDIFNGYDNLLAALNYVKHRYHGDVTGVLGHGHGYDSGGWLNDIGFNLTGRPEAVLTPEESRAYVKHADAITGSGGEMRLDDWSISRLAQALSTRPIPVHVDGRQVAAAVVPHLERRF